MFSLQMAGELISGHRNSIVKMLRKHHRKHPFDHLRKQLGQFSWLLPQGRRTGSMVCNLPVVRVACERLGSSHLHRSG